MRGDQSAAQQLVASTKQGKDQWQARAETAREVRGRRRRDGAGEAAAARRGGERRCGGEGPWAVRARRAGGLCGEAAAGAVAAAVGGGVASAHAYWLAAVHAPSIRHSVVPMVGPSLHAVFDLDESHSWHGTPSSAAA